MSEAICKGCGKPIVWGKTDDGKKIPLDPRPPCYSTQPDPNDPTKINAWRARDAMVSHFATCPKASKF